MYVCIHIYLSDIFLMASGGPEFLPLFITPFYMSDLNLYLI